MIKKLTILLLLIQLTLVIKTNAHKIYGFISDAKTGEKLIGAVLYLPETKQGVTSNAFGYYSLVVPESFNVHISYIGYKPLNLNLKINKDSTFNFTLQPGIAINEVTITDSRLKGLHKQVQMSTNSIEMQSIKRMPNFFGETNILKTYQSMPGVTQGTETSSALHVRGGSPDQNRIILDDAPLYYINHYGGFFSIFNDDAIKNSTLITGGFPAKYGGRLSSILDIRMNDGNKNKFSGNVSVGILASKVMIEGPVSKNITCMISARITLVDKFMSLIQNLNNSPQFGFGFYDINAKTNIHINQKNRILISYYKGDDVYFSKNKEEGNESSNAYNWGNHMATIRLNHIFSANLFGNISAIYTQYRFGFNTEYNDEKTDYETNYNSKISDLILKLNLDYYLNNSLKISFGGTLTEHSYMPGTYNTEYSSLGIDNTNFEDFSNINYKGYEGNGYFEIEHDIIEKLSFVAGIHSSVFNAYNTTYNSIEPRLSLKYAINNLSSLKGSFCTMKQYQHLLSYPGGGMPTDLWVSATNEVKPQVSRIAAIGFAKTLTSIACELSSEIYYKDMDNLIEYSEGVSFYSGDNWQNKIEKEGWGNSYGFELLFKKNKGKTTGWISYCLSKTNRQFENINYGNKYPYKYDRTHNISLVLMHKISEKIDISATWFYYTGEALTLGSGSYPTMAYPSYSSNIPSNPSLGEPAFVYKGRNSIKGEPTHRLDLGINYTKEKKRGVSTWNISVYNAYARKNPSYYNYITENGKTTLNKVSEYMFLPSINYSFKF